MKKIFVFFMMLVLACMSVTLVGCQDPVNNSSSTTGGSSGSSAESSIKLSGEFIAINSYFDFNQGDALGQHWVSYGYKGKFGITIYTVNGKNVTVDYNPTVVLTLSDDGNTLTDPDGLVFTKQ